MKKMKVVAGDSFFKSLKKLGSLRHRYIEMPWYNFKHGVKNLWNFRKIVWVQRHWDYFSILQMQQFQMKKLKTTIENGLEVDETRLPKVEQLSRCIEIIQHILDDDGFVGDTYLDRVGYDLDKINFEFVPADEEGFFEMKSESPYSDEETKELYEKADKLEKEERKELYKIINENSNGWWD